MSSPSRQHTLARTVQAAGVGLHGGRSIHVRLLPAPAGHGVRFRRLDAPAEVPALATAVREVDHATTLAPDAVATEVVGTSAGVRTVEHLLAALHALEIDNCKVEVQGDELPIFDGSASAWVELLDCAGRKKQRASRRLRRLLRTVSVEVGDAVVTAHPSHDFRVSCSIDFAHPAIGRQEISLTVDPETFREQLSAARTFGFLRDVERLRAAGLAHGASLDNAIVLDDEGVVNGPLRFADEFVRHKALDLVGDMALTGAPLLAHVVARRAGHRAHVELAKEILRRTDAWVMEDAREESVAGPLLVPAASFHGVAALAHD